MTPEEQAERARIVRQLDILLAVCAVELNVQERKDQDRALREHRLVHPWAGAAKRHDAA